MSLDAETVFSFEATTSSLAWGAALEAGWELRCMDEGRVLVFLNPNLQHLPAPQKVLSEIQKAGIETVLFTERRVEPSLDLFEAAAAFARLVKVDWYVAIAGGSTIDTAKVANLLATHGGEVMDYVNPPIGLGKETARTAAALGRHPLPNALIALVKTWVCCLVWLSKAMNLPTSLLL